MANVTTGSVSAQFQAYFSKMLLERALPLLQMEQFAMKVRILRKLAATKQSGSLSSIILLSTRSFPSLKERLLAMARINVS
jgi:hypothetical protein